jgi:hypothetical protein
MFTAPTRYHANQSMTQGLGIGIFNTKQIVDMHDGILTASSVGEGLGSTFSLLLPLRDSSNPKFWIQHHSLTAMETLSINQNIAHTRSCLKVFCDDTILCRKILRQYLLPVVSECIEACNGLDAVEKVRQHKEEGCPFDVILMDSSMPVMCGGEASLLIGTQTSSSR